MFVILVGSPSLLAAPKTRSRSSPFAFDPILFPAASTEAIGFLLRGFLTAVLRLGVGRFDIGCNSSPDPLHR